MIEKAWRMDGSPATPVIYGIITSVKTLPKTTLMRQSGTALNVLAQQSKLNTAGLRFLSMLAAGYK